MAFRASAGTRTRVRAGANLPDRARGFSSLTCEVVVLLAVGVGERHQLPEQQGVLEHPLHRFNQVGLQGGRVLLGGVPGIQELLEGLIGLGWKTKADPSTPESSSPTSPSQHELPSATSFLVKGDDIFSERRTFKREPLKY